MEPETGISATEPEMSEIRPLIYTPEGREIFREALTYPIAPRPVQPAPAGRDADTDYGHGGEQTFEWDEASHA